MATPFFFNRHSQSPIKLDSNLIYAQVIIAQKKKLIDSTFQPSSISDKIEFNNSFLWALLDSNYFETSNITRHNKAPTNTFSLPLEIDSNTIIIQHGWFYDPLYAGEEIDIWRYENGEWEKIGSYLIWMS